jgi:hypothetical protein
VEDNGSSLFNHHHFRGHLLVPIHPRCGWRCCQPCAPCAADSVSSHRRNCEDSADFGKQPELHSHRDCSRGVLQPTCSRFLSAQPGHDAHRAHNFSKAAGDPLATAASAGQKKRTLPPQGPSSCVQLPSDRPDNHQHSGCRAYLVREHTAIALSQSSPREIDHVISRGEMLCAVREHEHEPAADVAGLYE